MSKITKKIAALALAGALVTGALGFAQSASADLIPDSTLTITPTTGNKTDEIFLQSIATNTGCPVGYRDTSGTVAFQAGVRKGSVADVRTASAQGEGAGQTGLTGGAILMDRTIAPTNNWVSNKRLDQVANGGIIEGAWELRLYCFANGQLPDYVNDKYFSLAMTMDAAGVWAVQGTVVVVPAQATTVSLTALLAADNTATLSATVKDSTSATATAAAGSVEFLEGSTVVGTGAVANGLASFTTGALAVGSHSFTARFLSSDTVAYANSPLSGSATVVVPAGPAAPGSTVIDVAVPAGTGALSFTGLQANISLGTAALDSGLFKASGNLGPVTVTDTRQLGSAGWSLTGQTTDFVDGAKSIDGKYLGWTPALVGSSNAGIAGAAVAPGVTGLKTASALSTGTVVDGTQTTTVGAALALAAPGNTPGGSYTATLTLTLI